MALTLSTARHNGSHAQYNTRVFYKLQDILNNYGPSISSQEAISELNILMSTIRTAINNNPNTHINDLIF